MQLPAPIDRKGRIEGVDVLRGLAIFGILMINILQMFRPMSIANWPVAIVANGVGMWPVWLVTDALFENKFITIFSLLFGMGFGLQWLRTRDSPKRFRRLYLRRLAVLAVFGFVHAVFFYMADVLVIYALSALLLLPLRRWPARRLLWFGSVLLGLMVVWNGYLNGPHKADFAQQHRQTVQEISEIRDRGVIHLEQTDYDLPMPADIAILVLDGNNDREQAKVQYAVFSEGPLKAANFGRLIHFAALILLYTPFYLAWRTLALFALGAGLVKWGFLEESHRGLWRKIVRYGFGVGLPLTIVATTIRALGYETQTSWLYVGDVLHDVSSVILALAIVAAVFDWSHGRQHLIREGLSAVGRTALTNYIGQSVVMSLIATSYGLGLYGDLSLLQLALLSVGCFVGQMWISQLWLRPFRMGPLEWLWRCLTYWRLLPLRSA